MLQIKAYCNGNSLHEKIEMVTLDREDKNHIGLMCPHDMRIIDLMIIEIPDPEDDIEIELQNES